MTTAVIRSISQVEAFLKEKQNDLLATSVIILSHGSSAKRTSVKEFYGQNFSQAWQKFLLFYQQLPKDEDLRIDLITEEIEVTYEQLLSKFREIKRNNYLPFGFRLEGLKRRLFLKEELTANALLVPDKQHRVGKNKPNLQLNTPNIRNYLKVKYAMAESMDKLLQSSQIIIFKTAAILIEKNTIIPLEDYGYGNHVRGTTYQNFPHLLDLVIQEGSYFLQNQLTPSGRFIYGYYPCYDKVIKNYNSIRHFSSLYALLEAGEASQDHQVIADSLKGLTWGFKHLSTIKKDDYFIKEELINTVEYKLGAQAMAILAAAKYTQITNDTQFLPIIRQLVQTIEQFFLTSDDETIHVLDESFQIKEKFRIVYYDGEALFALLRAYALLKDEQILNLCRRLMNHFVANNYERYHDHWLSYAVNEFLIYEERDDYYLFGLKNALSKIDFIKNRDTAYPTMLELLVAAAKMMTKLKTYSRRNSLLTDEEFLAAQEKIATVMDHRAYHEVMTGTMFPEFARYFKNPTNITYGFFARHDRFRMRIDDAEHFLSGLINYRQFKERGE